jgi:hypothetical protein
VHAKNNSGAAGSSCIDGMAASMNATGELEAAAGHCIAVCPASTCETHPSKLHGDDTTVCTCPACFFQFRSYTYAFRHL